jgi:hypothetical protein
MAPAGDALVIAIAMEHAPKLLQGHTSSSPCASWLIAVTSQTMNGLTTAIPPPATPVLLLVSLPNAATSPARRCSSLASLVEKKVLVPVGKGL